MGAMDTIGLLSFISEFALLPLASSRYNLKVFLSPFNFPGYGRVCLDADHFTHDFRALKIVTECSQCAEQKDLGA